MPSPTIIHVASEAYPLAKSGGLGDVIGALPAALRRAGEATVVFLPAYPWVFERADGAVALDPPVEVVTGVGRHTFELFHTVLSGEGCPAVLFKCDPLFGRARMYDEDGREYGDNAYRFGVFCQAGLAALKALDWTPRILHVHDWQAALVPVLLRTLYEEDPYFAQVRTVFTIHNLAYQGWAPRAVLDELNLPAALLHHDLLEAGGAVNLMKGGIAFADHITTVSPRYAREIGTTEHGQGLDGVLHTRAGRLSGILNGVDLTVWDPSTDELLPRTYDASTWREGKAAARAALMHTFGIEAAADQPLVGFIGRFTEQKGLDVLLDALPALLGSGGRLVMIGTGDRGLVDAWLDAARVHAGALGVEVAYSEACAHLIQAGVDMIVMPSRYEPCGLNQLYAMCYGTVPVVHAVGGLMDTVVPATPETVAAGYATGIRFDRLDAGSLADAFRRAFSLFADRAVWARLVEACFRQDFSWDRSARTYQALYREVLVRPPHMPYRDVPHFPRPATRPTYERENRELIEAFWHPYFEPAMRLMVQGPTSIYAYWELDEEMHGQLTHDVRLELYDITTGETRSIESNASPLGEYWFAVMPDRTYEVAWVSGRRRVLVTNRVRTPRAGLSDHWATDDAAVWVTLDALSKKARDALVARHRRIMSMTGRAGGSSRYRPDTPAEGKAS